MLTARAALEEAHWINDLGFLPGFLPAGVTVGFTGLRDQPPEHRHHAKQVHGTRVVSASALPTEADGVYSLSTSEVVAVKTADCLPVLFAHPRWVAAVHAGWRGLAAGILPEALKLAGECGAGRSEMRAVIGPAIGATAFEVGPEVIAALEDGPIPLSEKELEFCLLKGVGDRWHVDLQQAAVLMMMHAGLDPRHMVIVRQCTHSTPGRWHSFRRDKDKAGSNWSWIKRL